VYTEFWWGNLRQNDHLEDLSADGIILKRILKIGSVGNGLD
jgi:hypothetical protein